MSVKNAIWIECLSSLNGTIFGFYTGIPNLFKQCWRSKMKQYLE